MFSSVHKKVFCACCVFLIFDYCLVELIQLDEYNVHSDRSKKNLWKVLLCMKTENWYPWIKLSYA